MLLHRDQPCWQFGVMRYAIWPFETALRRNPRLFLNQEGSVDRPR